MNHNSEEICPKIIARYPLSAEEQNENRLNFRIPRNFGPPHLHVSGGSEDRGITQ